MSTNAVNIPAKKMETSPSTTKRPQAGSKPQLSSDGLNKSSNMIKKQSKHKADLPGPGNNKHGLSGSSSHSVQQPSSKREGSSTNPSRVTRHARRSANKPYEPIRLPKDILTIQAHSASTPVTELPYLLIAAHIGALPSTRQFYPTTASCHTPLTVFRDMFVMTMDVRGYKPSSVRLSTEGRLIIIECLQSEVPPVDFTQTGTVNSEDKYVVDPPPNISSMPIHTSFNYTQHRIKLPDDFSDEGLKVGMDEVTGHVIITGRLVHAQPTSFPEPWNKDGVIKKTKGPLVNTSNLNLSKDDARKLAAWNAVQSESQQQQQQAGTKSTDVNTSLLQYGRKQWLEREGAKLRAIQHRALKENIRKLTEMNKKVSTTGNSVAVGNKAQLLPKTPASSNIGPDSKQGSFLGNDSKKASPDPSPATITKLNSSSSKNPSSNEPSKSDAPAPPPSTTETTTRIPDRNIKEPLGFSPLLPAIQESPQEDAAPGMTAAPVSDNMREGEDPSRNLNVSIQSENPASCSGSSTPTRPKSPAKGTVTPTLRSPSKEEEHKDLSALHNQERLLESSNNTPVKPFSNEPEAAAAGRSSKPNKEPVSSNNIDDAVNKIVHGTESNSDLNHSAGGKVHLEEFRDLIHQVVAAGHTVSDEEPEDPIGKQDKDMWEKLLNHARTAAAEANNLLLEEQRAARQAPAGNNQNLENSS